LPGLVDAARRNLARSVPDVELYEVGPVDRRAADPKEAPRESTAAAAILVGRRAGWLKPDEPYDFFDAKEIARELLRALGVEAPVYVPAPKGKGTALLHPGVSAEIRAGGAEGHRIGQLGQIHPRLRRRLGLEARAFHLEVVLHAVAEERHPVRSVAPPHFP